MCIHGFASFLDMLICSSMIFSISMIVSSSVSLSLDAVAAAAADDHK